MANSRRGRLRNICSRRGDLRCVTGHPTSASWASLLDETVYVVVDDGPIQVRILVDGQVRSWGRTSVRQDVLVRRSNGRRR